MNNSIYTALLTSSLLLVFVFDLSADRIVPHSCDLPETTIGQATTNQHTCEDFSRTEGWCLTKLELIEHSYTWTISNYSLLTQEMGQSIDSPTFSSSDGKSQWKLQLYPAGEPYSNGSYLSLYLILVSEPSTVGQPVMAKYKMSIMDADGLEEHSERTYDGCSFEVGSPQGFDHFFSRSALKISELRLLPDDKLTIRCEVYLEVVRKHQSGRAFFSPVQKSGLREDFANLLESEELSDTTVVVAGQEFKVHRAILMARSPMFKTMLKSDEQIQVDDMEPDVFRELIRYIYTGKSSLLEPEGQQVNEKDLALKLLTAAVKYQVDGLKSICEHILYRNLSVESLVELLSLADENNCQWLRDRAIEYLMRHANEFTQIGGWNLLAKQSPELLGEVLAGHWSAGH